MVHVQFGALGREAKSFCLSASVSLGELLKFEALPQSRIYVNRELCESQTMLKDGDVIVAVPDSIEGASDERATECAFCGSQPPVAEYKHRGYDRIGSRGREAEGWYAVCLGCDRHLRSNVKALRTNIISLKLKLLLEAKNDAARREAGVVGLRIDRKLRGFLRAWTGERHELIQPGHSLRGATIDFVCALSGTEQHARVNADTTYFCRGCGRTARLADTHDA